jgi:uncharacterized protein (TIGR03435 family)
MLQTLLADRFKLMLHKEQRDMPLYALVIAPNGLKFQPSLSDRKCPKQRPEDPWVARFGFSCGIISGGPSSGIKGFNVDTAKLVETLGNFGDRQVVDRTGIKGTFDVDLPPWNRSAQVPAEPLDQPVRDREDPAGPSIFTVLQEKLGLRLESIRGPADIYVVDQVERPTPN